MNAKKNLAKIKFCLLSASFLAPTLVLAAYEGIKNPLKSDTFQGLITNIADFLLKIGAAVAVLIIIYGGFLYITSGGDEKKVTAARQTLTWAVIGLTIAMMGESFIYIIQDLLGAK